MLICFVFFLHSEMKDEHILLVNHFPTSEMCEINQVIIKIDWYLSPTGKQMYNVLTRWPTALLLCMSDILM
jgi:hypothetical protein